MIHSTPLVCVYCKYRRPHPSNSETASPVQKEASITIILFFSFSLSFSLLLHYLQLHLSLFYSSVRLFISSLLASSSFSFHIFSLFWKRTLSLSTHLSRFYSDPIQTKPKQKSNKTDISNNRKKEKEKNVIVAAM